MLEPRASPSAIAIRSSSHRKRADTGGIGSVIAAYVRVAPVRVVTTRPYRQRWPVLRLTPTTRDAAALLMPCFIKARYCARLFVSGCAPGDFRGR